MKQFCIIEVGSTNTKSYYYNNGNLTEFPLITLEFKANYKKLGHLAKTDIAALVALVKKLKKICPKVFVYGTSVFRDLPKEQKTAFKQSFLNATGAKFTIVSAAKENEYTVYGVTAGNNYTGPLCVMVGGGGSTELSFVENKKIKHKVLNKFGVADVYNAFPELNKTNPPYAFANMIKTFKNKMPKHLPACEVLVLAGGNFLMFYENVSPQSLKKNTMYTDTEQPFTITRSKANEVDKLYIYEQDLNSYLTKFADNAGWWKGTRGMRICVSAVGSAIGAKTIVPTKINMVYGIIEKLKAGKA